MSEKKSCTTCKHFIYETCRRNPPSVPPKGALSDFYTYPKVDPEKPCGEHAINFPDPMSIPVGKVKKGAK